MKKFWHTLFSMLLKRVILFMVIQKKSGEKIFEALAVKEEEFYEEEGREALFVL